jgi:hypothetical protein
MLEYNDRVRLTASELAALRQRAAKHGLAIDTIRTSDDYLEALMKAHPKKTELILQDLEEFIATGSSPLIRGERSLTEIGDD